MHIVAMTIPPYQSVAQVMLVQLLWRSPDVSIRRKRGPEALERLPGQEDGAVGGLFEICPEEGSSVSRDLGGTHEPLGDLVEVEPGHRRVSKRRDEVDMLDLRDCQRGIATADGARAWWC
jgi:hypothetical protein